MTGNEKRLCSMKVYYLFISNIIDQSTYVNLNPQVLGILLMLKRKKMYDQKLNLIKTLGEKKIFFPVFEIFGGVLVSIK